MRKLLLSLTLLSAALLLPPSSKAQFIVVGQACGASGLNGISTNGTPVVCTGNPLVWTAVGGGGAGGGVPGQFSVKTYGAVGDAKQASCSVTGSSNVVTSSTAHFSTNAHAGQIFYAIDGSVPVIRIPFNQAYPMATISSVDSDTQIHVSTNANGTTPSASCTWGTQEEDASISSAGNAASIINGVAPGGTLNTNIGPATLTYPGNVYIPPGGYILKEQSTVFKCASTGDSGNLICPNFIGAGSNKVTFYIEPTATAPLIQYGVTGSSGTNGISVGGFTFTSSGFTVPVNGGGFPIFLISINARGFDFYDIDAFNTGLNGSAGSGIVTCAGCQNGSFRSFYMQQGTTGSNAPWFVITSGGDSVTVRDSLFSNQSGAPNIYLQNTSKRTPTSAPPLFESVLVDECVSGNGDCVRMANAQAIFSGGNVWGGSNGAISVDATSTLWLDNSNVGAFNTSNNVDALNIASGGTVFAHGNTLRGNSAGFVLNGPVGASFIDAGANTYQNCVTTTCTAITAATYATQFATGGIVPQASIQMPTNTVYAVTGNLLATAQNLATIPLSVNQQLTNIRAQSGGTTPANSSCATPPVITFSDGTRTETLQMTSGQTQWCSTTLGSCTASTVTNPNQVFASGSLLTISIGANTCATPPANVSVSYNVQSVLNP